MLKRYSAVALALTMAIALVGIAYAPASALSQDEADLICALFGCDSAQKASVDALVSGGGGGSCPALTQPLTVGSTGPNVEALQSYLVGTGHLVMPAGVPMGYFGPITQAAVAAWQTANAVAPPAGYFGPISLAAYNDVCMPSGDSADDANDDGDDGDFFGGDAEGFLDDFDQISKYSSEEVGEGEEDAIVLGVEFEAKDADQMIERVTAVFDTPSAAAEDDLEDFIEDVSLWLDGEELGRKDVDECSHTRSTDTYTCRFNGLMGVVGEDDMAELLVGVSGVRKLGAGIAGEGFTVTIPADGIRAASPNGVTDEYDTTAYDEPFTLDTFAGAQGVELKVKKSNDSPDDRIVNVDLTSDTDGVELLRGTLEADGSDLVLFELPVLLTATGVADLDLLANRLILDIDGNEYSETISTAGVAVATITFDDLELDMEDGDPMPFTISADVNDLEGTFGDGDTLKAELTASEVDAIVAEDESGEELGAADLTGTALGDVASFYDVGIFVSLKGVAKSFTAQDGDNNDSGTFEIEFEVEAFDGTIYLADSPLATTATAIEEATVDESDYGGALLYRVEGGGTPTVANLTHDLDYTTNDGASLVAGDIELADGESTVLTLNVARTSNNAGDEGFFRLFLSSIGWQTSQATDVFNVFDFNLEDYKTGTVNIVN